MLFGIEQKVGQQFAIGENGVIDEIAVLRPRGWSTHDRGLLAARVAGEFPSVHVRCEDGDGSVAHVRASEWRRGDFDHWRFDERVDALADATLLLEDDDEERRRPGGWPDGVSPSRAGVGTTPGQPAWTPALPDFPLEVLTRCQRAIGRRNACSEGPHFDRILARHRQLHDLARPLVRADYNHALDVWQWIVRLDRGASLAVQIAALFHDVERLASEPERRVEHLAPDYQRFKDAHAREGSAVTHAVLLAAGVAPATCRRAAELVAAHERPSDDREVALLNDADALSFFSLNSSGYADYFGPEQTKKKVAYSWNRMGPAARAKLPGVRLRDDVRALLDEVTS